MVQRRSIPGQLVLEWRVTGEKVDRWKFRFETANVAEKNRERARSESCVWSGVDHSYLILVVGAIRTIQSSLSSDFILIWQQRIQLLVYCQNLIVKGRKNYKGELNVVCYALSRFMFEKGRVWFEYWMPATSLHCSCGLHLVYLNFSII